MSNKLKGEVTIQAGDRELIMVYSTDALIDLESRFDKSVQEIGAMLGDNLKISDLRSVFRAGLIQYHPEVTEQEAGLLMSQMGILEAGQLVGRAFSLAFNAGPEVSKAARPSRRPVVTGRGTGTPAATSGLNSGSEASVTSDA